MHISIFDLHSLAAIKVHTATAQEKSYFLTEMRDHAANEVSTATAQEQSYFLTVILGAGWTEERRHSDNMNPTTIAVMNVMLTMYAGGAPVLKRGR
jgi:hypothetical protein